MVKLYVRNWRCIGEVDVSLKPITLFIGRNSTGKSSLAYAPYFLSKIVEWRDVNKVLMHLYGAGLDSVVMSDGEGRFYPVIVKAGESCFEARSPNDLRIPENSPWKDSYLLPSQRLSFTKISQLIPKLVREIEKRYPEARVFIMFASWLFETLKTIPILPPMYFFLEDLFKLYLGKGFSKHYELGDMGVVFEKISPLLSLVVREYGDPFTKLRLPLDLAPDGIVDTMTIKLFIERASQNSLIVIEEPENYKNPVMIIELMKDLAVKAVEKKLTLIITTHNDIAVQAIVKAVEEKRIKPDNTAVYYFERSPENPWTKVRELKVYEDGTIEELPDVEKVVSALF